MKPIYTMSLQGLFPDNSDYDDEFEAGSKQEAINHFHRFLKTYGISKEYIRGTIREIPHQK